MIHKTSPEKFIFSKIYDEIANEFFHKKFSKFWKKYLHSCKSRRLMIPVYIYSIYIYIYTYSIYIYIHIYYIIYIYIYIIYYIYICHVAGCKPWWHITSYSYHILFFCLEYATLLLTFAYSLQWPLWCCKVSD